MASPISCGLARAARSASLSSSGNGTFAISPEERGHPRARVAIDVAADPLGQLVALASRSPRPRECRPRAGSRAPSIANGEPAPSESPMPNSTSPRSGWRCTHSTNSWRRRDLPTPAAPDHQHRRRHRFGHRARRTGSSSIDISRPRPTKSVALPSRLRLTSNTSRSPRRNGAVPSRRISKRVSSSPTATSSRRIAPGARPAQQAHAVVDHLARRPTRPRTAPAPSTPPAARRAARRASPARSARRAPPDRSPCRRRAASAPPHRRAAGAAAPRARARDRPPAPPAGGAGTAASPRRRRRTAARSRPASAARRSSTARR